LQLPANAAAYQAAVKKMFVTSYKAYQYVASFDVIPILSRAETGLLGVTSCYAFPECVLMDRIDGELVLPML
jgi:hypothetical protein